MSHIATTVAAPRFAPCAALAALAAAALLSFSVPARADWVQIIPTNKQVSPGQFGTVLQVWTRGRAYEFSVAAGEIAREVATDEKRATDWVTARFGLDPSRHLIEFCPGGWLGASCALGNGPEFDWPTPP